MFRLLPSAFLAMLILPAAVSAHYPWFTLDSSPGNKGGVNFVFEDGLLAGTGEFLDPFIKDAKYWLRTGDKNAPTPLKFEEVKKDGKRWLSFPVKASSPRAIDCYCLWGVYQGKLLHYYARHLTVSSAEQLAKVARAENLKFDLVPRIDKNMIEVEVLWEGRPAPGKSVLIFGPKLRVTETSDAKGLVRFKVENPGFYGLRSAFIEPEPAGKYSGMDYKGLRQTATMTITVPPVLAGK